MKDFYKWVQSLGLYYSFHNIAGALILKVK